MTSGSPRRSSTTLSANSLANAFDLIAIRVSLAAKKGEDGGERQVKNIVRNIIAVVAGVAALMAGKWVATKLGLALIPPPAGSDLTTPEGFQAAIPLFELKNWITPFFEHAVGSFAGGFVAALVAGSHKMKFGIAIGALHMLGAIVAVAMLPIPIWFSALDLTIAYLPMAWIGAKLASRD